jgi:uncharacterized protein YndB with AHSA1/START domain
MSPRMKTDATAPAVDRSIVISAPPARVLGAFFDPSALSAWWQTCRSVTSPRPLGVYAVEWEPTLEVDDVLGRLGGVFYGVIVEYKPGRELFVADAWWIPPDGDPLGPMSLQVDCAPERHACHLRVRQSGFENSPRWERYYRIIDHGWETSLAALKIHVERPHPKT